MKTMKYYIQVAMLTLLGATLSFTACSDDIPDGDLYTYEAEMLSDWLRSHDDFSEFAQIVERAGRMDLLSTYGQYTCFAPTNEAVHEYLASIGLQSVGQLSVEDCDTITRTALVERRLFMADLGEALEESSEDAASSSRTVFIQTPNMLGRYLSIEAVPITVNEEQWDGVVRETETNTYCINGSGQIIYELRNDSVENGVVHPVDAMVVSSSLTLPLLIKEDPNISIFSLCLQLTGIDQQMHRIKDPSWDPIYWRDTRGKQKEYETGAQKDYCWVPEERKFGYTAFCVPDSILEAEYGITDWEGLYDYACTKYTNGVGQDYYGKTPSALKDPRNPLHKLIAYHLLNRKGIYNKLYTNCSIYHGDINSMEWYSTMDSLSTLKVEHISTLYNKFRGSSTPNTLYLNRMYDPDRPGLTQRGAIVSPSVADGLKQEAVNGVYYYIDRIIDFGETTKSTVFNTRMRIDLYSIFPECMNNDMRTDRTWGNLATEDPNADARNYIFPVGYLENVKLEDDGDFFLQGCRNYFWSYEGDEFNLRSSNDSYDITFNLPSVPTGQYQIRLGFTAMAKRGIAQFYIDGVPQGIPLDMRHTDDVAFAKRIGGHVPLSQLSGERAEQVKKNMHNLGWYHGPKSFRFVNTGANSLKDDRQLSTSNSTATSETARITRRVLFEGPLDENIQHTMRIRSVMALGGAELMIDYLEIVPKSVYGIGGDGKGEDDL